MEEYAIYLFYLAVVLILGIMITGITNRLKLSNILFLVLAGYMLQRFNFNYFNDELILVLSAFALILITLETTMELDLSHIMKNFLQVFKFSIVYFILTGYILTLLIYLVFDIPGKGFEVFVLCMLLSIIIYGVDPIIAMEFFKTRATKIKEMLEIEGIISGPVVVVFSFFIINYLQSSMASFSLSIISQMAVIGKQVFVALVISMFLAFLLYKFLKNFEMSHELASLLVIAVALIVFVLGEFLGTNGSMAVAIYGIFLRGLTKKEMPRRYTAVFAHTLYIIVFVLFGIEFFFPEIGLWIKSLGVFVVYLMLRFTCILLFFRMINFKEKLFMTLNVAKGIEVAIVLFIMKLNFSNIEGINLILGLGFMFFILSYILSTIVNHFNIFFLDHKRHHTT